MQMDSSAYNAFMEYDCHNNMMTRIATMKFLSFFFELTAGALPNLLSRRRKQSFTMLL
jgi:hypothetical protein